jgi:hypothetical protein
MKNTLGTANAPSQADQTGDIDAKGAIAPGTQYTFSPQNFLHLLEFLPADPSFFSVNHPQGVDEFVGGHVSGFLLPAAVKKATVGAERAMGTHLEGR